jgi:hypothetical protein
LQSINSSDAQDVRLLDWNFNKCCEALQGERHKREMLKRLLEHTLEASLPKWNARIAEELKRTRKRIQQLSAKKSRLRKSLSVVVTASTTKKC